MAPIPAEGGRAGRERRASVLLRFMQEQCAEPSAQQRREGAHQRPAAGMGQAPVGGLVHDHRPERADGPPVRAMGGDVLRRDAQKGGETIAPGRQLHEAGVGPERGETAIADRARKEGVRVHASGAPSMPRARIVTPCRRAMRSNAAFTTS